MKNARKVEMSKVTTIGWFAKRLFVPAEHICAFYCTIVNQAMLMTTALNDSLPPILVIWCHKVAIEKKIPTELSGSAPLRQLFEDGQLKLSLRVTARKEAFNLALIQCGD